MLRKATFSRKGRRIDAPIRDFDEYELESEKAGPVFQLAARKTF